MVADKKPTANNHQRWLQFASLAIDISNVTRNTSNNAHKVIGAIYPANWISDLQKGGTMPGARKRLSSNSSKLKSMYEHVWRMRRADITVFTSQYVPRGFAVLLNISFTNMTDV